MNWPPRGRNDFVYSQMTDHLINTQSRAYCRVNVGSSSVPFLEQITCNELNFDNQNTNMKQPELGKKISELRKAKGLTQEELVEKCNISVRTIQRIETGDVTPRMYTIKTILAALDHDLDAISDDGTQFTEPISNRVKDFLMIDVDLSRPGLVNQLNIAWIAGIVYFALRVSGGCSRILSIHNRRINIWKRCLCCNQGLHVGLCRILSSRIDCRGRDIRKLSFKNSLNDPHRLLSLSQLRMTSSRFFTIHSNGKPSLQRFRFRLAVWGLYLESP